MSEKEGKIEKLRTPVTATACDFCYDIVGKKEHFSASLTKKKETVFIHG